MSKPRKRYTDEFRAQAVAMVENGRPTLEVARELEIETSCLYAWLRKSRAQTQPFESEGVRAEGKESAADELQRLRREITKLKSENNILKKAAIILGTDPSSNSAK